MSDRCDNFREDVCWVSRRLREEDVRQLEYLYELPHQRGTNPSSLQLETLLELERTGVFSKYSPEGLKLVLEKIERKDLIEWVEKYIRIRQEKRTRPEVVKLIGDHETTCREVDSKAKALATRMKEILGMEEKASSEGATTTQLLLPLLEMASELQSSSADCVQQCAVLENVARRSTSDSPPCTGMRDNSCID